MSIRLGLVTVALASALLVVAWAETSAIPRGTPAIRPATPKRAAVETLQPNLITPVATSTPAAAATPSDAGRLKLDMNAIFPPGEGQDLVFTECLNSCHTFVPLLQQKTKQAWEMTCRGHLIRHIPTMELTRWRRLCNYLETHFNPETPLPELPPQFQRTWAAY